MKMPFGNSDQMNILFYSFFISAVNGALIAIL
jgi:hypothetical protein